MDFDFLRTEPKRIDCPFAPGVYVVLPAQWLGRHSLRLSRALGVARQDKEWGGNKDFLDMVASLSLAEDWGGIEALPHDNPSAWQFEEAPLAILGWLAAEVLTDYAKAKTVPKVYSSLSLNGSVATAGAETHSS